MILNLYSVLDQKTEIYHQPFVAVNDNDAQRLLQMANMKKESEYIVFPEDFQVRCIGIWDNNKGILKTDSGHPRIVCDMVTLVNAQEKNPPS